MKNLKFLVFIALIGLTFNSFAQSESAIDKKIAKMMEIQGTTDQMVLAIDQMIDIQKGAYGGELGDEFWDSLKEEFTGEALTDLVQELVPIYKKHLLESEIDAIIAFYSSEAGQSLLKKTPLIMQESMSIGAAWGQKIGENLVKKMQEKKKD